MLDLGQNFYDVRVRMMWSAVGPNGPCFDYPLLEIERSKALFQLLLQFRRHLEFRGTSAAQIIAYGVCGILVSRLTDLLLPCCDALVVYLLKPGRLFYLKIFPSPLIPPQIIRIESLKNAPEQRSD